mmetsp:Transcript_63826/g.152224  ORF Transcript_63826/g.152224 Transcript_63826/m.152224 type:complete len:200 (-) Transcript_63826:701-1300(-)
MLPRTSTPSSRPSTLPTKSTATLPSTARRWRGWTKWCSGSGPRRRPRTPPCPRSCARGQAARNTCSFSATRMIRLWGTRSSRCGSPGRRWGPLPRPLKKNSGTRRRRRCSQTRWTCMRGGVRSSPCPLSCACESNSRTPNGSCWWTTTHTSSWNPSRRCSPCRTENLARGTWGMRCYSGHTGASGAATSVWLIQGRGSS